MNLSEDLNGKKVIGFIFIDRLNEGLGFRRPKENETFWYSHEYLGDHAENWIQIVINNKITEIINVTDLSVIDFEKEE
jgi:hypothetical protein